MFSLTSGSKRSRRMLVYVSQRTYSKKKKKGGKGVGLIRTAWEPKAQQCHTHARSSTGSLVFRTFVVKSEHKTCLWQKHTAKCLPSRASISFFTSSQCSLKKKSQLNYQSEIKKKCHRDGKRTEILLNPSEFYNHVCTKLPEDLVQEKAAGITFFSQQIELHSTNLIMRILCLKQA